VASGARHGALADSQRQDCLIVVDYAVDGRNYVGHRVFCSAGGSSTADATAQEIAEKYPPGADVTVFYDPKRPATAVLEPRSMQNAATSLAFMLAFGFLGLVFLGMALR
jgi:Protein of unknown function (DUF3592)